MKYNTEWIARRWRETNCIKNEEDMCLESNEFSALALLRSRVLSRCSEVLELEGRGGFLEKMSWRAAPLISGRWWEEKMCWGSQTLSSAMQEKPLSSWVDGKRAGAAFRPQRDWRKREILGQTSPYISPVTHRSCGRSDK
ncbi:unnamed protein product [Pleuronectes platessa]|uniref:Uncharacterized protein n=1 Tax=Pleuronectes platessa TaxID=8262 RepID=A0A9N7VMT9_PLEPL|nr:unnamed protein product [Pleuronectes platessa]